MYILVTKQNRTIREEHECALMGGGGRFVQGGGIGDVSGGVGEAQKNKIARDYKGRRGLF